MSIPCSQINILVTEHKDESMIIKVWNNPRIGLIYFPSLQVIFKQVPKVKMRILHL